MRSVFALFVLGGLSLGVIITAVVMTQQQELELAEVRTQHEARVERLISNHQVQLDALEDVDEACAELFERNIDLEVKVIEMEGVVIQAEINCLWRLHRDAKVRCDSER